MVVKGSVSDVRMPEGIRRDQFLAWVEQLEDRTTPDWLGLPNNAERVLLANRGQLQPFTKEKDSARLGELSFLVWLVLIVKDNFDLTEKQGFKRLVTIHSFGIRLCVQIVPLPLIQA